MVNLDMKLVENYFTRKAYQTIECRQGPRSFQSAPKKYAGDLGLSSWTLLTKWGQNSVCHHTQIISSNYLGMVP